MTSERNAFKAGLFIVIAAALGIAIVISIKGAGRLTGPRQTRTAYFKLTDDVGGLRVGDDLRIGGHKVGVVQSIELIDNDAGDSTAAKAEPTLAVQFRLPQRIVLREGVKLSVQTQLTGSSVLNIESLGTGKPLPADTALVGNPDPKSALIAALGKMTPKLETTVSDAQVAIAQVKTTSVPKLNSAVDRAGAFVDRAGEAMVELRDTLGPSKTDYKGTIANLNVTTAHLKERLPELLAHADEVIKNLNGSLSKAQTALDDVNATMANAKELTATMREVLAGNKGKLHAMIASLKVTGDNLKAASAEVRRSPWRLLYKPAPNEMANLNLYDSARQFADGANALDDAATALRDAVQQKDADPERVKKLMEKLDQSFAGFQQVEQKLWADVKD
jgi:ABC-type transporter Mla subunit MlaD